MFTKLSQASEIIARNLIIDGLVAMLEAGKLGDHEYMLMEELGFAQEVESKASLRAGAEPNEEEGFLMETMPHISLTTLAWE